jgi:hypothetical protein
VDGKPEEERTSNASKDRNLRVCELAGSENLEDKVILGLAIGITVIVEKMNKFNEEIC